MKNIETSPRYFDMKNINNRLIQAINIVTVHRKMNIIQINNFSCPSPES